jgi:hypothetical protein
VESGADARHVEATNKCAVATSASSGHLTFPSMGVVQVRNKTVYLQYSTRQEIGSGHWGEGSGAGHPGSGSVILVIMDNIQVGRAGGGGGATPP